MCKGSLSQNLCIKCNHEKNYYYLNYYPLQSRKKYIDCIKEISKPSNFYFNQQNLDFEPCYSSCLTCEYGGNNEENNCTLCDEINYIKDPEEENSLNCVIKCRYFYYIEYNVYKCTKVPYCPVEHQFVIKNKSKCINNCRNDKEYKYKYNRECFKQCPNNTKDDNDFICKDIQNNECVLTENDNNLINENLNFIQIESLVIKYVEEFNYTNSHVSLYKNGDYTLIIYINNKCVSELDLEIPDINFGSCYEKIKYSENPYNDELIIGVINKRIHLKNTKKVIKYGIFSPLTGKYLDSDEICQEDKIIFTDNIENKLLESKVNLQLVKEFFNEGIDIFNMSSPFYTDICFQYNSKKDIALKDRVLEYFPNITLCEDGCELLGINMSTITAICECFYIESKRDENIKNKVMEQSQISFVEDIISSSNIYVIKCIDLVFKKNTIKKSYGSIIIICLMLIELICIIFYSKNNIYSINKYILSLTNQYINYLLVINSNKIQFKNSLRNKTNLISNENIVEKNAPPKQNKRKTMNYMKPNIAKIEKKSKTIRKPKIRGDINIIFNNNNETNNKDNINKQNQVISNNNKIMSKPNY